MALVFIFSVILKPQFSDEFLERKERAELQNEKVRIECEEKGGKLYGITAFNLNCAFPTTDAGKSCTDSSECEGHCNPVHIATMTDSYPFNFQCEKPTLKSGNSCYENTGVCADDTMFHNCGSEMINGKIESIMCID